MACPEARRVLIARTAAWWALGALAVVQSQLAGAARPYAVDEMLSFTDRHCAGCHNDVDREGGLDLTQLTYPSGVGSNVATWVKVHDRVAAGEMPPPEKERPDLSDTAAFISGVGASIASAEQAVLAREGRTTYRRLNRIEYENTLRDLLQLPWLQIGDKLPEDGEVYKFNKSSAALDVSHVHMSRYLEAAEYAMREAIALQFTRPATTTKRYYARDERILTKFQPDAIVNDGPPDRHKFPVTGTEAQPDVRAYLAPLSVGAADPVRREQEAIGWVSSNYPGFGTGWINFQAPVTGRYRLRFSGYTLWAAPGGNMRHFSSGEDRVGTDVAPEWFHPNFDVISSGRRSEPITIYSKGGRSSRRLGAFDLTPEPSVNQLDGILLYANEYVVTDASRLFRARPTSFRGGYTNPLAQKDGMPAVAFRWMEVEGPLYDETTTAGYRLLFGDLALRKTADGTSGVPIEVVSSLPGGQVREEFRQQVRYYELLRIPAPGLAQATVLANTTVEVVSANPPRDAERLLRSFMAKAYRRPVQEADVQLFLALINQQLAAGLDFTRAMLAGYTAVLASPAFVYIEENPGRLDDHTLATRLALFLWNGAPDETLRRRADRGELHRLDVLRAETNRMLEDPKSGRFVTAFLDYWLDLRRMEETTPSTSLYNDYYLDDSLAEAAREETHLFFTELLRRDLPARTVVDSDFTFLNDRLARHYDISGVEGTALRRVALPSDSLRGGVMTQASVLKVTANGTTTSPVVRGKWIMERILGHDVPLPPAAVPAVEPDIRGAVTMREQLEKHRADESCAICHRRIDPPGFALENFDVMGGWRDRYRAPAPDRAPHLGFGKNGWPFSFAFARPVDASGELPDGRTFTDIREFKRLLLREEVVIARNLAKQLSIYATGAPVRFSDRAEIERIVQATRPREFGLRSLVQQIIESNLFLNK